MGYHYNTPNKIKIVWPLSFSHCDWCIFYRTSITLHNVQSNLCTMTTNGKVNVKIEWPAEFLTLCKYVYIFTESGGQYDEECTEECPW